MRYKDTVVVDLSREFFSNGAVKRQRRQGTANAKISRLRRLLLLQTGSALLWATSGSAHRRGWWSGLTAQSEPGACCSLSVAGCSGPHPGCGRAAACAGRYDDTCSVMAFGFDPYLSEANPYEGAKFAVVTSVSKLVAAGCDPDAVYLSFQNICVYAKTRCAGNRCRRCWARWRRRIEVAAIGGKDSMSGSFNDMGVPPTLISFAIAPNDARFVISLSSKLQATPSSL